MSKESANAMQKDLYDTATFFKIMRRVEWPDQLLLEAVIQRTKEHLGRLEAMLKEAQLQAKVDSR